LQRLLFAVLITFLSLNLRAQVYQHAQKYAPPTTRVLFIFDASQSMYGRWETGTKIDVAQQIMGKMLDSLQRLDAPHLQLALRVYGHQKPVPPQDCNDTKLEVPFAPGNFQKIKNRLATIRPKGTTPIAHSLIKSAGDFPPCDDCRNIIILITDGIEACDGDPCEASRFLQTKGIALKPFVIGIGLDENFRKTFACVGQYFNATDEAEFETVLGIIISQVLDNTTAQVNLLDQAGKPTETDEPVLFLDQLNGAVRYSFMHTLNYMGVPDTLMIDPLMTYNLVVFTIPQVRKDSIVLTPGKHNHIGVHAPQGSLELRTAGGKRVDGLKAVIRVAGDNSILHVQDFNTRQKYLTGAYDVEILSLPRYVERNVIISQSKTTNLNIPEPGQVSFQGTAPGYGAVLLERDNRWEWVTDLDEHNPRQNLTLQPGHYKVVWRSKKARQTVFSHSQNFTITSGGTTIIKLK
jgi:Ca-activated chloride channel family protein